MALRRSASVDSVFIHPSYVSSPQLSLHTYCGQLMIDRSSQTPEEWEVRNKRKTLRKINDRNFVLIKGKSKQQQQQRNAHKGFKSLSNKDEINNLLSSTSSPSPSSSINASPQHIPKQELSNNAAVITTTISKSGPIAIPNKLALELSNYRTGNSIEELNREIENLVLKGSSDNNCVGTDRIPEGHRAPVIELLCPRRTVKTQTFHSDIDNDHDNTDNTDNTRNGDITSEESCPSSDISRSESPISSTETATINDSNNVDYSSSPKINKFLTREPPDGCEKVKIVNEDDARRRANSNIFHSVVSGFAPKSGCVLLPSRSSAFLPIPKSNYYNSNALSAMDNLKNEINKVK